MTSRDFCYWLQGESVLRWLNEKSYRYVYPNDPAFRIVERLIAEGRAVRLGGSTRVAITRTGHATLTTSEDTEAK